MEEFSKLVEELMLLDKKTLAELVALRVYRERNGLSCPPAYPQAPIQEPYSPYVPTWPPTPIPTSPTYPWTTGPIDVPNWPVITCYSNTTTTVS